MSGSSDTSTNEDKSPKLQIVAPITIPKVFEGVIGSMIMASQLPALLKIRILATAANPSIHSSIHESGLIPKSILQSTMSLSKGLTPPIPKFANDAIRRIFIGGFFSTTVYSNILSEVERNIDWMKSTKNFRFQCAFLFMPSPSLFRFPIIAAVPENLFINNFLKDDFSIVKVLAERKWIFPNTVSIPGAYKSVPDFSLLPHYFLGSPKFSARALLYEAMHDQLVNPQRYLRGASFFSIGAALLFHAMRTPDDET